jgi:hypothetical protein
VTHQRQSVARLLRGDELIEALRDLNVDVDSAGGDTVRVFCEWRPTGWRPGRRRLLRFSTRRGLDLVGRLSDARGVPPSNQGIDAFVAKLNPTASELDYSTFLGGSGYDRAFDIAVHRHQGRRW